ncbi:MAG: threonine--tRNA ligase [Candidatus Micrarchaeota archaeon]|nr:threonine--tRNA ligase [Candidatus Micrarchaeota archaeon]
MHLTPTPSSPDVAVKVLQGMEHFLDSKDFQVIRAPFGWYKSFDVKCKGHPLSELSREIHSGGEVKKEAREIGAGKTYERSVTESTMVSDSVSASLKAEDKTVKEYFILTEDGTLTPTSSFNYSKNPNLKKFVEYETKKVRAYAQEPPHIKIMKEHALVDFEPGSDSGNFRWYPKGRLMKRILERDITDYCVNYGAMEVETPVMYDFEHPSLKKYMNRFPARQYVVKSDDKEFFLRFAACFGQFLMAHDMVISYKNLPLRMFELTRYSFRREQSGELAGLKRLRAFTMPDMHTICRDLEQARGEFGSQLEMADKWLKSLGLEYETSFRVLKDFFEENREWYVGLVKKLGKPVMIEIFDQRYAYFITKFEFNFVDFMDKASALSTVQIDVENAETYDINFVDEDGSKKKPPILHASISGSLERVVYALLEKCALEMKEGKKTMLPLYLSPTHVRIVPVSDAQIPKCEEYLSELLASSCVRADLDDRKETLQKKVREAEKDWVPYIAVVGDREIASGKLAVRVRSTGEQKPMSASELAEEIRKQCEGKPFEKLSLPDHISKRPII